MSYAAVPTLDRIVVRVRDTVDNTALVTRFQYREHYCRLARVLYINSRYAGLIELAQPATPAQLAALTNVMHIGAPFAFSCIRGERHFVGFHTLHAADTPSMPGGRRRSPEYVAEQLKHGVDVLITLALKPDKQQPRAGVVLPPAQTPPTR